MRTAFLAASYMALFIAVESASAAARRSVGTGGAYERAARAEERSRVERTRICRGCNVSLSPNRGKTQGRLPDRSRPPRVRSTTIRAPIPGLPLTSTAEAQAQDLNRAIAMQQQRVHFQQQTHFEFNQLRRELQLQRDYWFR